MSAITIDFHNTLIECDAWFEIEVRTLVRDFVERAELAGEFDASGVDLDLLDQAYRNLRMEIHQHGNEVSANESVQFILNNHGHVISPRLVDSTVNNMMLEVLETARPVDGALEMLTDLGQQNVKLAVVSSAVHHDFLLWALERFEMLSYFELVSTSASTGFYKSRPGIYLNTLKLLETEPSHALHLGDSLRFDVGGASVAGMKTAWFNRGDGRGVYDDHPIPDVAVTDLSQAAGPLLETLKGKS
jgi:FMN phosphatase YigB (HAD superfamily)